MNSRQWYYIVATLLVFVMCSCEKEFEEATYEEGTNEYVNQWMKTQMKRYYYWNENLPSKVNLSLNPETYFKELLYSEDRFSYTYHPDRAETFPKSLPKTYGFEMGFRTYENTIYGVVLFILPDSPAERLGLSRGTYIEQINGKQINTANYQSLYLELVSSEQVTLQVMEYLEKSGLSSSTSISLNSGFSFDAAINHAILEKGGKKIGYVSIPRFGVGLARPLISVFSELKNKDISELIIDLRYNGGGDVSSATALSIILALNISRDDIFIKFDGNENGGIIYQTFKEALGMNEHRVSYDELRNVHPAIDEVYILCGNHTASASEIVINNLRPYITVKTIGAITVGKDVAGFPIKEERDSEEQGWILQPSIYKLFNADEQGNYHQGIAPDYSVDELEEMLVKPLGNVEETLLSFALDLITNKARSTSIVQQKVDFSKVFVPALSEPILTGKFK